MVVRENGLYWVILRTINVNWQIAQWYKDAKIWRLLGYPDYSDTVYDVDIVGPRIVVPKKVKVKKEVIKVRKDGYYWVKRKGWWYPAQWSVPLYDKPFFLVNKQTEIRAEDYFDKIGPRISPPEGE